MQRFSLLAWMAAWPLAALVLAGCQNTSRDGTYVGAWGSGDGSLVVRPNGLAEGRLFGATSDRAFTWRADGPTLRLTFGRIARDTIEYRGTIDEAGRLVVESDKGSCVLKRASAGSP